jgi:hypothetical protein
MRNGSEYFGSGKNQVIALVETRLIASLHLYEITLTTTNIFTLISQQNGVAV